MKYLTKNRWNVEIEREFVAIDTKDVKVITLTLSSRGVLFGSTSSAYNFDGKGNTERTICLNSCWGSVVGGGWIDLNIPNGYEYGWIMFDKYDVIITLINKDVSLFWL